MTVTVAAGAVTAEMPVVATPTFSLLPVHASVAIDGDFALDYGNTSSEIAIRAGLEPRLIVTLISDTWVQALGREYDSNGPSMQLLNGLVSEQSEPYGWMASVRQRLTPDAIHYINAGEIEIRLPQIPDYEIAAPETIVLSVPAAAMRNNDEDIPAAARFVVLAARGTVELGGSILASVTEADIAGANVTVDVRLHHDTFTSDAMCEGGVQTALTLTAAPLDDEWCWPIPKLPPNVLDAPPPPPPGPRCEPHQEHGWTHVMSDLPCTGLAKLADDHLRLTLPPAAAFDLQTSETISVTVNAFALTSNRSTLAYPDFAVRPAAGSAELSGSFLQANESAIRAGGLELVVTLVGGEWRPFLDERTRAQVLRGLSSSQREPSGDCAFAAACPVGSNPPCAAPP